MRALALGLLLLAACAPQGVAPSPAPTTAEPGVTLFDPDPGHLWNRLYARLNTWAPAASGEGRLLVDTLRWPGDPDSVSGESQKSAAALLDEFSTTGAESLIRDPLRRAVFQSNLLLLYEWAVASKTTTLRARLANVIRRVALTEEEIRSLPDTYAAAAGAKSLPSAFDPTRPDQTFLAPDLLDPSGPWVLLGDGEGPERKPIAQRHAAFFGGRSEFLVFVRVPNDRNATLDYVKELMAHQKQASVPAAPPGTHFALLRRMLLLDAAGRVRATSIVESLQMRVLGSYPGGRTITGGNQRLFELSLRRDDLLRGRDGGLRAVLADEATPGLDVFLGTNTFPPSRSELPRTQPLTFCTVCHRNAGAVESFQRLSVLDLPRAHVRALGVAEEERRILADSEARSLFAALRSER